MSFITAGWGKNKLFLIKECDISTTQRRPYVQEQVINIKQILQFLCPIIWLYLVVLLLLLSLSNFYLVHSFRWYLSLFSWLWGSLLWFWILVWFFWEKRLIVEWIGMGEDLKGVGGTNMIIIYLILKLFLIVKYNLKIEIYF